eukprot:6971924-Prymnesium_polylepis.1
MAHSSIHSEQKTYGALWGTAPYMDMVTGDRMHRRAAAEGEPGCDVFMWVPDLGLSLRARP